MCAGRAVGRPRSASSRSDSRAARCHLDATPNFTPDIGGTRGEGRRRPGARMPPMRQGKASAGSSRRYATLTAFRAMSARSVFTLRRPSGPMRQRHSPGGTSTATSTARPRATVAVARRTPPILVAERLGQPWAVRRGSRQCVRWSVRRHNTIHTEYEKCSHSTARPRRGPAARQRPSPPARQPARPSVCQTEHLGSKSVDGRTDSYLPPPPPPACARFLSRRAVAATRRPPRLLSHTPFTAPLPPGLFLSMPAS